MPLAPFFFARARSTESRPDRSEQPGVDGFLDRGEFAIGLEQLVFGGLRAKLRRSGVVFGGQYPLLGMFPGAGGLLKPAIELGDGLELRALGGFLLAFGLKQFFRQALAQRVGLGLALARVVFHVVKEFGGLVDQVQRGLAKILFVGSGEAENVLLFPARRSIPIVPDVLAELLIASVRHVRAPFTEHQSRKTIATW